MCYFAFTDFTELSTFTLNFNHVSEKFMTEAFRKKFKSICRKKLIVNVINKYVK